MRHLRFIRARAAPLGGYMTQKLAARARRPSIDYTGLTGEFLRSCFGRLFRAVFRVRLYVPKRSCKGLSAERVGFGLS